MKPTQKEIDEALETAKRMGKVKYFDETSQFVVISKAYEYEKTRADLLQKQLAHLLNMVNRVTCAYRHGGKVSYIAYQDMNCLCDAQIEIEDEIEKNKKDNP
jgi:hypothetical protein